MHKRVPTVADRLLVGQCVVFAAPISRRTNMRYDPDHRPGPIDLMNGDMTIEQFMDSPEGEELLPGYGIASADEAADLMRAWVGQTVKIVMWVALREPDARACAVSLVGELREAGVRDDVPEPVFEITSADQWLGLRVGGRGIRSPEGAHGRALVLNLAGGGGLAFVRLSECGGA